MLLEVKNLRVGYGAIEALHGVDLNINEGEIVALVGANGAGKTTLLRALSGLIRPREGEILLDGAEPLHRLKPHEIVRVGVCHVPEGRQIFTSLTVRENLLLGGYLRKKAATAGAAHHDPDADVQRVFELFPILAERRKQKSGTLSGGEQQMLAIGRALMSRPKLLLLDEPSLGLAPLIVRKIFEIIKEINAAGATVFLVEQNAHMALTHAHRAYVLQCGEIVKSDHAARLLEDPDVKKAYLGG